MEKYYVDKSLTQVAVGRKRPTFLAERLFPVTYHDDLTGFYWVLDGNDASLITQNTERAPGSSPHSLYTEPPTKQTFTVKDHSLQDSLPDEYKSRTEPALRREQDKVVKLRDALDLVKEVRMLTALQAGLTNVTAPATKFDDYTSTTFDPIDFLLGQFDLVEMNAGAQPNVMALDAKVARAIMNHPKVKARGLPTMGPDRYNTGISTMENVLAALLGLDEVMIATGSIRNIARKKETKNIVRTWSDNIVLGYREAPTTEGYAGMGITVKWNPPAEQGEQVVNGMLVERERLGGGKKAWAFYVHDYYVQIVMNAKSGIWIPDVLT